MKKIDLAPCIKSGIDMEFAQNLDYDVWDVGALTGINKNTDVWRPYIKSHTKCYYHCRPRMNHWHSWKGGECPFPEGFEFEVRLRDEEVTSSWGRWLYDPEGELEHYDIIAFRIIGTAEGWEL